MYLTEMNMLDYKIMIYKNTKWKAASTWEHNLKLQKRKRKLEGKKDKLNEELIQL